MRHLKTLESLYANQFLEKTNTIKDILSNYNIKYDIQEAEPKMIITFPYAEAMYQGKWVDQEYKLILSFLEQLIRNEVKFKVIEDDQETKVEIDMS